VGQFIGAIVAENVGLAKAATFAVRVTYGAEEDEAAPQVLSSADSDFGVVTTPPLDPALQAPQLATISAKLQTSGQKHFYMEPHNAYAIPEEDGIVVYLPMQWPDCVHGAVAMSLQLPLTKVRAIHRRAGGGFGGKITFSGWMASLVAVAAMKLQAPVRLLLDRNTDMGMMGGREEMLAKYDVAYEDDGRITAAKFEGILNGGFNIDLSWFTVMSLAGSFTQAYNFSNVLVSADLVRSNLSCRTAVRGPCEPEASYSVETIIEHIAQLTGLSPQAVREKNLFTGKEPKDQLVAPNGHSLEPYTIPKLWYQLKEQAKFDAKVQEANTFNSNNRWKKRGVSMTPVRYEVAIHNKSALVNIYGDGSIVITHAGCEIGQGMNTKVAQVAVYELGKVFEGKVKVPLEKVKFGDTDNQVIPNAMFTGGSTGSEGVAEAARRCCGTIVARLVPALAALKDKLTKDGKDPNAVTWEALIAFAKGDSINLSAQDLWSGKAPDAVAYMNYGAAVSVVEVDVITGEVSILSTDLLYDCGKSLNPAIDIGQCEGAFMMGVGFYLREQSWIEGSGELVSNGTWEYKPPGVKDLPLQFNVELLQNAEFDKGILSSKASGEPPLVLATSVATAVRHAISSARHDIGLDGFFDIPVPLTPDVIVAACGDQQAHFTL